MVQTLHFEGEIVVDGEVPSSGEIAHAIIVLLVSTVAKTSAQLQHAYLQLGTPSGTTTLPSHGTELW